MPYKDTLLKQEDEYYGYFDGNENASPDIVWDNYPFDAWNFRVWFPSISKR